MTVEDQKDSEKMSNRFLDDSQKSKYLDVPSVFRKPSSEQRLLLTRDDMQPKETQWGNLLARSVSPIEELVYDNPKYPRAK
jgi:hypothetical protein